MKPNVGHVPSSILAKLLSRAGLSVALALAACAEPAPGPSPAGLNSDSPDPGTASSVAPGTEPPSTPVRPVAPGDEREDRLEAEALHAYELPLLADELVQLTVEQRGVDVAVSLFDPQGARLLRVDSPNGKNGPEKLLALTSTAGAHRLEIEAFGNQPGGEYRLSFELRRPASAADRQRAEAMKTFMEGEDLRRRRSYNEALSRYGSALATWEGLGDASWQGEAHFRKGLVHSRRGEVESAFEAYGRAATLFGEAGALSQQGAAIFQIGDAQRRRGDYSEAIASYRRSLDLRQAAGSRWGVAASLDALGVTYRAQGEMQRALEAYDQVLELWGEAGVPKDRAMTLVNQAIVYRQLGQQRLARDRLQEAVSIYRTLPFPRILAGALDQLALVHATLGEPDRAMEAYRQALELQLEADDHPGEAVSRNGMGILFKQRGDLQAAEESYQAALQIFRRAGNRLDEARLLNNLASLSNVTERPSAALDFTDQSLALARQLREPDTETRALVVRARALRALGRFDQALETQEQALEIIESVRVRTGSLGFRATYLATAQEYYDDHIDLLAELSVNRSDDSLAERALATSERARARSLLEGLGEARTDLHRGADPALLDREKELEEELARLGADKRRLQAALPESRNELSGVERRLRERLADLQQLEARLRQSHPRYAELTHQHPLSVPQIRREVLDPETLLVEYRLAEHRSFLWVVDGESTQLHRLPGREDLESRARRAAELLARGNRRESQAAIRRHLCTLSRDLLGPAADSLGDSRLVIVADGALQYLPFAALPDPRFEDCEDAPPLLEGHEIIGLPSASTLAVLRQHQRRARSIASVAVMADPIFGAADPRLGGTEGSESATTRAESPDRDLPRLLYSRLEAEAIAALASPEGHFQALGSEARKEILTGGRLDDFDVIHLATHGVLDTEHPELSGVVLSRLDAQGEPIDGFLYAHELYGLSLDAEMVVLSACRTALGAEIRGEGLVGLTHGFLHAGTERVVVSLWQVNDRATSELMSRFYRHLLVEGLRPAAALREAQLSMRRESTTREPFWWAAFVLQGEWR